MAAIGESELICLTESRADKLIEQQQEGGKRMLNHQAAVISSEGSTSPDSLQLSIETYTELPD